MSATARKIHNQLTAKSFGRKDTSRWWEDPNTLENASLTDLVEKQRDEERKWQSEQYGAQAKGLESVVSGYEQILANADKYGGDVSAIWKGVEDTLNEIEAKRVAAIQQGYDPQTIETSYNNAIANIQGAVEEISGIHQDLVGEIDTLAKTAPYNARSRLSLMRDAIMQPTVEAADQIADVIQRTGGNGSTMPMTASLMKQAFETMIPYTGDQITAAQQAREGLLGRKTDLGKWFGTETAGLKRNLADLEVGKGRDLTAANQWRASNLSSIYGDTARNQMDVARGKAAGTTSAFQAKSSAIEGLSKARGGLAEASAMQKASSKYLPTDYSSLITQALNKKNSFSSSANTAGSAGKPSLGGQEVASPSRKPTSTYAERQAARVKKWYG